MEKEFKLKTSYGEVISKTKVDTKELAIDFFCKMKNLKPEDLLKIYKVE